MKCPVCETETIYSHGYSETLVGYLSPVGHDHNDNCKIHQFSCVNGHQWTQRNQNTCPECDWKGKEECFCHPLGVKVYEQVV